jgi:hypothetical protein
MIRTYRVESLTEKKAIKLLYDDNKEHVQFRIIRKENVDIDKAIKLLSIIGTKEAIKWIYILEIVKMVGWEKFIEFDFLNEIKDNLSIKATESDIILQYKDALPIAIFYIPHIVRETVLLKLSQSPFDIMANKSEIIKILTNAINNAKSYFDSIDTIKKIEDKKDAFIINLEAMDDVDVNSIFGENEKLNNLIKQEIIAKIMGFASKNIEDKKILLILPYGCKKDLLYAAKYKDLFNRESIRHFFEALQKTNDLGYAMFDTDIKYDDIEFDLRGTIQEESRALYYKYYFQSTIDQLKRNEFYGFKFKDNKVIEISNLSYLEPYVYIM